MSDVVRIGEASPFELLTVASLFLVALLGTIIAYQAYRGYRRNDARSMFYLAIGLLLLTLCPFLVNVTINTFTGAQQVVTVFFENVSRLLGLVAITYSLYGHH
ncbi:DUF7521 family protein [Natronobacterium gregoryi]|uniref:Uncharacterized protein n=2 Tax=Natronobacterium gregoryi TaxID=44930 RepID=L0AL99_NATGS|nr:hypothetical protein [Natronobacterium gregoryi]AFZ74219.1 hypothetical protein Natgr_3086 [Natronobacterium gregoryi SP2]ELY63675.1 hypothetical protein C490_15534 [Natronobacterium gregoryi SP2]PLK21993.1 hypothetical protein CYV19_00940 [Natronobacterium gregoryi SP2]SFI51724.1 hypothetical protein SAMN05443661_101106 [Natronobacterium gregoryi]